MPRPLEKLSHVLCLFAVCGEAVSSPYHIRVLQWNVLSQGS